MGGWGLRRRQRRLPRRGVLYLRHGPLVGSNTNDPETDTASWTIKVAEVGGLSQAVQNAIDSQGAINFGDVYQGAWAVGAYAVGDVAYHDGVFYECDVTRTAANLNNPAVNTGAWSVKTVTFQLMGDVTVDLTSVTNAIQNVIDAQGTANFGDKYKGSWSAGVHAVGDVSYHDGAFYTCTVARAASDTDDPATDTASWSIEVSESGGLDTAVQGAIDAVGAIQFGEVYKGKWAIGIFSVDDVVYHAGQFYVCTQNRTANNINNPAVNTPAWDVKTVDVANVDISGLSADVQNAINAQATAAYGGSYQGVWAAGAFAVGNVVYHDGAFYTCDTARSAANTDNPATDAASWSIKVAEAGGLSQAVQNAIDAQAAINFGEDYQGAWEPGVFVVGDIVYFGGSFYECDVARNVGHTNNPSINTGAWSVKTVTFELEGDLTVDLSEISAAVQDAINAQATAAYGSNYQGVWAAGIFAVGNVVYHSGAFYTCDVARTASNTDDPETDTASWTIKLAETGGLSQAVQNAIDSQGAIQFGEDYKGAWAVGEFFIDDVVYFDGQFYICTRDRTAAHPNNPAINTNSWDVKTVEAADVDLSSVTTGVQNAIHAQATASYGENYQGTWAAGVYAVGNVVYHDGAFYTCDTARTSSNTNDPETDTGSWTIKLAETGGLSQAVQDAIDSQAKISFGENYKGKWEAGAYAVGDVVSHSGSFFECDTARSAGNTNNPATDTANWSVKESIEGGVIRAINNTIDALGAATFGDDYTGEWEAAAHAVGDVVSYNVRFYECNIARNAGHSNNPSINTGAWHLVGSAVTIRANLQDNIDALGAATYGEKYTGLWEAGVHAVDDYASYGGRFYRCKVARTSSNSSDPSADNTGWEAVGSSFTLQGDITTAKQENIDAAARIVFGDDYKGKWAIGAFAVGDVTYDEVTEKFYECDTARTNRATRTDRP